MLGYIKGEIAARAAEITSRPKRDDLDDSTIVEYAHIFQELEELSVDGLPENKMRPIEIPLDDEGNIEDDEFGNLEIEEIGYNVVTGTMSVPADAAIQSEYALMKTKDDFITESYNLIQGEEESDIDYESRRQQFAEDNFMKYRKEVLQEGVYGFNRIKVDSEQVPSFAAINFGKDGDSDYRVRLEIQHQVDKRGNLTRKQLESVYLAESCYMCEGLMPKVESDLRERYHISESANIWDTVIPSIFVAPVDPIYEHAVIIGFKNGANLSSYDFYRFSNPVDKYTTGKGSVNIAESFSVERLDPAQVKELSKYCMTKNAAIRESQKPNPRYHRVYQEAINLGGGSDGGGDNTNTSTDANNQNATPSGDNGGDNNTNPDNKATVEVNTNDVSNQIADKVASETKNETPDDGTNMDTGSGDDAMPDISGLDNMGAGDDDSSFTNDDGGSEETNSVESTDMGVGDVDSQLAELNASGNEDAALGDGDLSSGEIDIDNMSMDDLINQGTERLKSMSLSQLKEFLANNDATAVQEAFILTKANINDEVDVYLHKVLGILNDSKMDINSIVSEFKKYGKKLNRVLTKAAKVTAVYDNNEIDNIKKLNKCLSDLMVTIKASTDKSTIAVIKRLMKAFTSQASIVGKIVEKKKKDLPKAEKKEVNSKSKPVTESYFGYVLNDNNE